MPLGAGSSVGSAASLGTVTVSQTAATIPTATTMQNAAVANGNGTSLSTTGYANALIQVVSSPSMSGGTTVNFEGTADNSTWVAISGHQLGTATITTTTTADGDFRFSTTGLVNIRARISAYSAGTVTIIGYVTALTGTPNSVNAISVGNVARAATDSGNPIKIGGLATSPDSLTAAVTTGQRVDQAYDLSGRNINYMGTTIDSTNDSIAALGNVAHDAVDSGNPVKIGGYGSNAVPAGTADGDRTNLWLGNNGQAVVGLGSGSSSDSLTGGNFVNLAGVARVAGASQYVFNSSTWDRVRSVVNAMDTTGTGIAAAGILAQYDDTSPGTVTENQFSTLRMGSNRCLYVNGEIANDGVDSGNPVKIGVKATSSLPTQVAALDRADVLGDRYGRIGVFLGGYDSTNVSTSSPADGQSGITGLAVFSQNELYNAGAGGGWDRHRNNHEVTALASAARTTSTNSSDLTNYNGRGVQVVIDVTAVTATPDLTVTIKGKCTLSGKYFTLLASASISTVSTTTLTVYPGATVAANLSASVPIPRVWRVEVVAGDADSATYSISANYIN